VQEMTAILMEEIGLKEHFAALLAEAIVKGMRHRFGKQKVYIPATDRTALYKEMVAKFNGRNATEVLKSTGISKTTFYRKLGEVTKARQLIAKESQNLPDLGQF
jgi:DNA invertase Pin-like site-specific DNA recombinase